VERLLHTCASKGVAVICTLGMLSLGCTKEQDQPVPEIEVSSLKAVPGPRCVLSTEGIDFGTVTTDRENERTVTIENGGTEPLAIASITSSCTCTEADGAANTPLGPGDQTELCVRLKLEDYPKDDVHTFISLETNDPSSPVVKINVEAVIKPEFVLEPDNLDFGTVKRGRPYTRSFLLTQTGARNVVVTGVETPQGVDALVRERSDSQVKSYEISITLNPVVQQNDLWSKIAVLTNVPRLPRHEIGIQAKFTGIECKIEPGVIVFGPVRPGEWIGNLLVTGEGIRVLEATPSVDGIVATVEEMEPKRQFKVALYATTQALPGRRAGKLRLKLDDGDLIEVKCVNLYGTLIHK